MLRAHPLPTPLHRSELQTKEIVMIKVLQVVGFIVCIVVGFFCFKNVYKEVRGWMRASKEKRKIRKEYVKAVKRMSVGELKRNIKLM